jgi:hypothetical protein
MMNDKVRLGQAFIRFINPRNFLLVAMILSGAH